MGSKWDIEKFTGDNDFGLWKVKIEAVLIQQKCEKASKGEGLFLVTMSRAEKTEMVDKAKSAIVLCLGDKVLREVAKEPTATLMWAKLESSYMTKSLAHRQFLSQRPSWSNLRSSTISLMTWRTLRCILRMKIKL